MGLATIHNNFLVCPPLRAISPSYYLSSCCSPSQNFLMDKAPKLVISSSPRRYLSDSTLCWHQKPIQLSPIASLSSQENNSSRCNQESSSQKDPPDSKQNRVRWVFISFIGLTAILGALEERERRSSHPCCSLSRSELSDLAKELGIPTKIGFNYSHVKEACFQAILRNCNENNWAIFTRDLIPLISKITNSSRTPLLLALILEKKEAIAQKLIELGIDCQCTDTSGNNALHLVAQMGISNVSLIDLLFKHVPLTENKKKQNPLHVAIEAKQVRTVEILANHPMMSLTDPWVFKGANLSPVAHAVKSDHVEIFKVLMRANEKKDRLNLFSLHLTGIGNLVHFAIDCSSKTILNHLLYKYQNEMNSLLKEEDNQKRTPLHYAAFLGRVEEMQILHQYGVEIDQISSDRLNAVHWAATGVQIEALDCLDRLGAPLEQIDRFGKYPLNYLEPNYFISILSSQDLKKMSCYRYLSDLILTRQSGQTKAPNFSQSPPENLVLQGGGPKVIASIGALEVIEEKQMLVKVKRIAGTSAGAITAALLSVGYSASEIKSLLNENNLTTFLDPSNGLSNAMLALAMKGFSIKTLFSINTLFNVCKSGAMAFLSSKAVGAVISFEFIGDLITGKQVSDKINTIIYNSLKDLETTLQDLHRNYGSLNSLTSLYWKALKDGVYNVQPAGPFLQLANQKGLCDGEKFREWIDTAISSKIAEITKKDCKFLTFKELHRLSIKHSDQCKDLYVFALELQSGKQDLKRFSHEDAEWEDLIISDAIRASMSIPGVFKPHTLHFKDKRGGRVANANYGLYIDGGLIKNFPIDAFDDAKYQVSRFRAMITNRRTLGISLKLEEKSKETTPLSFLGYARAIMNVYYSAEDLWLAQNPYNKDRKVEIPIRNVGLLDFDMTEAKKQELMQAGRDAALKFFPE